MISNTNGEGRRGIEAKEGEEAFFLPAAALDFARSVSIDGKQLKRTVITPKPCQLHCRLFLLLLVQFYVGGGNSMIAWRVTAAVMIGWRVTAACGRGQDTNPCVVSRLSLHRSPTQAKGPASL